MNLGEMQAVQEVIEELKNREEPWLEIDVTHKRWKGKSAREIYTLIKDYGRTSGVDAKVMLRTLEERVFIARKDMKWGLGVPE